MILLYVLTINFILTSNIFKKDTGICASLGVAKDSIKNYHWGGGGFWWRQPDCAILFRVGFGGQNLKEGAKAKLYFQLY